MPDIEERSYGIKFLDLPISPSQSVDEHLLAEEVIPDSLSQRVVTRESAQQLNFAGILFCRRRGILGSVREVSTYNLPNPASDETAVVAWGALVDLSVFSRVIR